MESISESDAESAARGALQTSIEGVEKIDAGSNDVFQVTGAGGNRYVIKFNTFSLHRTFCAEIRTLQFLQNRLGIQVPEIVALDADYLTTPAPFFIMRYIDGQRPKPLTTHYSSRVVQQIGLSVLALHTLPVESLSGYGRVKSESGVEQLIADGDSWREYYYEFIHDTLDQANSLTSKELKPFVEPLRNELENQITEIPVQPRPSIVLPDFRLANVLINESKTLTGLVDFERADIGDAWWTVVNTHYLLGRGLNDEEKQQLKVDLREGFGGWPGENTYRAYRIGAVAKEVRAFENWWGHLPDDEYNEHLTRVKSAVQDLLSM